MLPIGKTLAGRKYFKARQFQRFLEKSQYWDRDSIDKFRTKQFLKIIAHCYQNVPFYRKYFDDNGLKISDFQTLDDVKKLPFITKEIIKHKKSELQALNFKERFIDHQTTGGTTGIPTNFGIDMTSVYKWDANSWRFWKYAGYDIGMPAIYFWAHPADLDISNSIHFKIKMLMENTTIFNCWDLSESKLDTFSNYINKTKPKIIRGYASAISLYVHSCKKLGIRLNNSPQGIIITADKIYESQMVEIADFFGCDVFNEYGCREFGILAHECQSHQGYHLAEESFVFEVCMSSTGKTQFYGNGELIATQLYNYAMPLLRYRTGDEVAISQEYCNCGRKLKLISHLNGRVIDYVLTKSNRHVHGTLFFYLFGDSKGVERFQIHQYEKGNIQVYIVKNEFFTEQSLSSTLSYLHEHYNGDLDYHVKYVNEVEVSPSGKRRICISHIN